MSARKKVPATQVRRYALVNTYGYCGCSMVSEDEVDGYHEGELDRGYVLWSDVEPLLEAGERCREALLDLVVWPEEPGGCWCPSWFTEKLGHNGHHQVCDAARAALAAWPEEEA